MNSIKKPFLEVILRYKFGIEPIFGNNYNPTAIAMCGDGLEKEIEDWYTQHEMRAKNG